ncbi:Glycinol 4-dimethylallyltransferase [Glycine soja]
MPKFDVLGSCASKALQNKRKIQMEYNLLRFQQPTLNHHYKSTERGHVYQESNIKYVVKAVSKPSFDYEPPTSNSKNMLESIKNFLAAFYWFCYPYTMVGRTLSTISACLIAVEKSSDISPLFFIGLLQALVPYTFLDVYINGVNQLSDLEIDKSFWLSWIIGSWPLIWSIVSCFTLWTAYSINTFVFKRPVVFPRSLVFLIVFMSFYSVGIALFKDIPDIEGDKKFGIHSFSARFGQKQVFWICVLLFETAFGVALLAGATSSCLWIKIATGLGHAALASILWYQAKYVDLTSKASVRSFYMLIWKLLFTSYFLIPLIR